MLIKQFTLFITDLLVLLMATFTTGYLLEYPDHLIDLYTKATTLCATLIISLLYISGLYDYTKHLTTPSIVTRTVFSIIIANTVTAAFFYFLGKWQFPSQIFLIMSGICLLLFPAHRALVGVILKRKNNKIVVAIGDEDFIGEASALYINRNIERFKPEPESIHKIEELINDEKVDRIIVSTTEDLNNIVNSFLLKTKISGIRVHDALSEAERIQRRIPVSLLKNRWLAAESGFSIYSHPYLRRSKRLFDISTGTIGLLLTLPIILFFIILIKLESRGPAIFKQKRIGFMNKEFTLYKLRSMHSDAEKHGAKWATVNDQRITALGKFIRKTRIDELPQFWNIIIGDMSLIGPRPEQPSFVKALEEKIPYYYLRHSIKPGLTGWAQINYPYGASTEDAQRKLEYELYYIKNMSLFLDIKIALKTAGVMLFGQGAR